MIMNGMLASLSDLASTMWITKKEWSDFLSFLLFGLRNFFENHLNRRGQSCLCVSRLSFNAGHIIMYAYAIIYVSMHTQLPMYPKKNNNLIFRNFDFWGIKCVHLLWRIYFYGYIEVFYCQWRIYCSVWLVWFAKNNFQILFNSYHRHDFHLFFISDISYYKKCYNVIYFFDRKYYFIQTNLY